MSAPDSRPEAAAKAAEPEPTPSLLPRRRAPAHDVHAAMNFEQLVAKVKQAEDALEAQERRISADWRQLKASWRAGWTPGRIVVAGLVGGFLIGRLDPARMFAKGGVVMQLVTMISGLLASGTAQAAASEAEHAASAAEDVAETVAPGLLDDHDADSGATTAHRPPGRANGADSARP